MPYPDYAYYRENGKMFSDIQAYRYSRTAVTIVDGDCLDQATAGFVSGNYFDVLGVPMAHGRLLEGMVFGIRPADALTMLTMPIILLVAAFLASFRPAHRAGKTHPMAALRDE